jgi:hypothetical protein
MNGAESDAEPRTPNFLRLRFIGYALMAAALITAVTVAAQPVTAHDSEPDSPAATAQSGSSVNTAGALEGSMGGKPEPGQLQLVTSDPRLAAAFAWARRQALDYAFSGDPVGDWYEAVLPGREGFCMRDTAHQVMGAHALGLDGDSVNMQEKFAASISDSKDWCGYWEINRYDRPAPVDYRNDAAFWFDLPGNFDVLDSCYRMYLWTGDQKYLYDPVFLDFYKHTVTDYVERWALDPEQVMKRKRIMNIRGLFNSQDKFQISRGIPSYDEGPNNFVVGVDLLAAEYAAYRAYSSIQAWRGNFGPAEAFAEKARAVQAFVNHTWWDEKNGHFYAFLDENGQLEGSNDVDVLYYGVADGGSKTQAALNGLVAAIKTNPSGPVEIESHYAEILYRYGVPDLAYSEIMDLTRKGRYRQEYPEVSFSVVGAIVSGLMGINIEAPLPEQSATHWNWAASAESTGNALSKQMAMAPPIEWNYVEAYVKTLPSLTKDTEWAEIRNLPIRANTVCIRHEGIHKTTFVNQRGPALEWRAAFPGTYETLLVDSQPIRASREIEASGRAGSWVQVTIGAGDTVTVETPAPQANH